MEPEEHARDEEPMVATQQRTTRTPMSVREFYDSLPETPGLRVEMLGDRLIVSPMGTPEHGWIGTLLLSALLPEALRHGWQAWPGTVDVCIAGTRTPIIPDFTMAPKDAPRWRKRELLSDGLTMVGEVVSPGSVREDREDKPPIYARGGVPLLLVIDPESSPPAVTLYSDPKNGRYAKTTSVTLGEKIHIPDPLDVELDTSIFLDD